MSRGRHILLAVAVLATALCVLPSAAEAGFPGANGTVVYTRGYPGPEQLYRIEPDGSLNNPLTSSVDNNAADWSPDGFMVAYSQAYFIDPPHLDQRHIYSIIPTTGQTRQLTSGSADDQSPAWSPDGQKIVFTRTVETGCEYDDHGNVTFCYGTSSIMVMNYDGSNLAPVPMGPACDGGSDPAWSPKGDKIAFTGCGGIWVMNPDGSGQAQLTTGGDLRPDWSPDGNRIAFCRCRTSDGIYAVNADGSGLTHLIPGPVVEDPAWSPDGYKIAYTTYAAATGHYQIRTVNIDGTNDNLLVDDTSLVSQPTWRPVPRSYVRPKGATPIRVSLVPAQNPCTNPNDTHGAPLAFGSCSPAELSSAYLTTGTPDANGNPVRMNGYLLARVKPGSPSTPADDADVRINVALNDVRNKDLSDYTGTLHANLPVRITDFDNQPGAGGPSPATTQPIAYGFQIPCTPDSSNSAGSNCSLSTTLDTILPNSIVEGARAIWQIGQVRVFDGGADGDGSTTSDNTVFAVEGVFVP